MPRVANQPRGMNCSESVAILRNGPSVNQMDGFSNKSTLIGLERTLLFRERLNSNRGIPKAQECRLPWQSF